MKTTFIYNLLIAYSPPFNWSKKYKTSSLGISYDAIVRSSALQAMSNAVAGKVDSWNTYIFLPWNTIRCCGGGIPSCSITFCLISATVSPESHSKSMIVPDRSYLHEKHEWDQNSMKFQKFAKQIILIVRYIFRIHTFRCNTVLTIVCYKLAARAIW